MPHRQENSALVANAALADWDRVVADHGDTVWRTVSRLVGNQADAADCYQNVFLEALEYSYRREIRSWGGLLAHLATMAALKCLRKRYAVRRQGTVVADETLVDPRPENVDRSARASELADALCDALNELPQRQAEVFCLACLEGMSYGEVAQQLEMTSNHVGVLLKRARERLQKKLSAHRLSGADTPSGG